MTHIVVCDDADGALRASGELPRLQAAATVTVYETAAPTRQALVERLRPAAVVLTMRGRTVLDRETLLDLPGLRLIASSGPHRIDVKAATDSGIAVATTGGTSTESVADHVLALMLALARGVVPADRALRQGRWEPVTGMELAGKILGILGLGRIGSAVARRALGFGLQVIAWGPTLSPERAAASGVEMVGEDEIFRRSDIVSVHLLLSDLSRDFVNAKRLALMKPSADSSRRGIVNRRELAQALHSGRIGAAATDLCDSSPVDMNDPILGAPRTVLTPHMGWQTRESQQRAARDSVDIILAYLEGRPTNVVNADVLKSERQAAIGGGR
ncbi:MAG: D-2-hydroxyacid dehydrogenase family protein [Betaproteobacteria bacterium]|nr:D-2-hydroxyacid dehydrogenase family protein [Betaproteobacteria bacterium]